MRIKYNTLFLEFERLQLSNWNSESLQNILTIISLSSLHMHTQEKNQEIL